MARKATAPSHLFDLISQAINNGTGLPGDFEERKDKFVTTWIIPERNFRCVLIERKRLSSRDLELHFMKESEKHSMLTLYTVERILHDFHPLASSSERAFSVFAAGEINHDPWNSGKLTRVIEANLWGRVIEPKTWG